jgi:hypothetical protein
MLSRSFQPRLDNAMPGCGFWFKPIARLDHQNICSDINNPKGVVYETFIQAF